MIAGKLNEVVILAEPIASKNNYGSTKTEWLERKVTKASVVQKNGDRVVVNNEIFNTYTVEFQIWDYHKINEKWRVFWNDNKYQIESIIPERNKKKLTIITSLVNE